MGYVEALKIMFKLLRCVEFKMIYLKFSYYLRLTSVTVNLVRVYSVYWRVSDHLEVFFSVANLTQEFSI